MPQSGQEQFACLFATMNDVAAGAGDWADVLRPMQDLLGVQASSLEIFDKSSGEFRFLATEPIDECEQRLYEERIYAINPRYCLLPNVAVGEIATDSAIPAEINLAAGEYYEWLKRAAGTRYFAGVKLFDTPDYLALSSIHVPEEHGAIDRPTQDLFAHLVPHLANALSVHQALARRGQLDIMDEEVAGPSRAYALLDRQGRILECSAEFERTVERSAGISLRDRRLVARGASDSARLAALIGAATCCDGANLPLGPIRFERPDARHGLLLRAVRLSRSREMFARLRPVAMLVLIDLDAPSAAAAEELRAAWQLTPREAELATLIGDGCRIEQAAALLGMTEQTARSHLKAIFRRMDIDRQTDLVRIVTRLGA